MVISDILLSVSFYKVKHSYCKEVKMKKSFIFLVTLIIIFIGQLSVADSGGGGPLNFATEPNLSTGINPWSDNGETSGLNMWGDGGGGPLWPWQDPDYFDTGPLWDWQHSDNPDSMFYDGPTADAGPDQTVDEGTVVTLDGSNSSDPDDGIASYQWTQTSGTPVTIDNDTAAQATFTTSQVGPGNEALIFQLAVTDNNGDRDTDICVVDVTWENDSPTADAGPDQTVDEGVVVTLDGSNSSDPDDGIASYQWTQTSGTPVTIDNDTAAQATFNSPYSGPPNDTLTFELEVCDNNGLSNSDSVEIRVSHKADGDLAPLGNRDGIVDVGDALIGLRFALGLLTPTQEDIYHGDTAPLDNDGEPSPDGQINVGDALVILQMALGITQNEGYDVAKSNKARDLSPSVAIDDIDELVAGNTEFALDLYHELIEKEAGNLFYSPHSISLALAMTYAGARDITEQQMSDALHFTLSQDLLHRAFNGLDLDLSKRGEGSDGQDGEEFRLNIANSVWGEKNYSFLTSFLDLLAENYGAGMRLVDFYNAPDVSRITINDWVSNETEEKIKNLIPPGAITSLTRLVLTNAIYFNAAWSFPFKEELTKDDIFYLDDGGRITAPIMTQTEHFNYTDGNNFQAIDFLYDGNEISMLILLPSPGQFVAFEDSITPAKLTSIISSLSMQNIKLSMPKFSYKSDSISLKELLSQMGMPTAFSSSADFSGMDGTHNLFISDVLHKAFVSVDEAGTEAAAATAVIISLTSAPSPPIEFNINRPFIFLIRDMKTGAILFMGRIVNPAG
jgi:serpin B